MPKTLPSVDNEVVAGCIEHPEIDNVVALSQSNMVDPRDVVVEGLILVTVSLQKEVSISVHSFHLERCKDLLIIIRKCR